MKRIDICTINLNGEEGRQTIYWDAEDKLLHSTADNPDEENPEYRCETVQEAQDTAFALWGNTAGWDLERIEHDDITRTEEDEDASRDFVLNVMENDRDGIEEMTPELAADILEWMRDDDEDGAIPSGLTAERFTEIWNDIKGIRPEEE